MAFMSVIITPELVVIVSCPMGMQSSVFEIHIVTCGLDVEQYSIAHVSQSVETSRKSALVSPYDETSSKE